MTIMFTELYFYSILLNTHVQVKDIPINFCVCKKQWKKNQNNVQVNAIKIHG